MVQIPNDLGLRMRLQTEAQLLQPTAPVTEIPADLPELRQGQAFTARIVEVLPENTYRALVAGKALTLALPEGAKSGDTLDLVVVDRSPRIVIAKLAAQPQAIEADSTPYQFATVSRTGQWVSSLLPAQGESPPAATLNRGQPLVAQAPAAGQPLSAAALANTLGSAVKASGLFYESHQAQWVTGQYSLAQLLEEPQAQHSNFSVLVGRLLADPAAGGTRAALLDAAVPNAAAGGTNAANPASAATGTAPGTPPPPGVPAQAANAAVLIAEADAAQTTVVATRRDGQPTGATTPPNPSAAATVADVDAAPTTLRALANVWRTPGAHDVAELERLAQWRAPAEAARDGASVRNATTALGDALPEDIRPVVQQQLDAAGTQRMLWHGEVWPRQGMQWEIERDGQRGSGNDDDSRWITSLTLTTPRLGEVAARLQVGHDGVRIAITASDTHSVDTLRDAIPALAESLAAAGVPLRGMLVRPREPLPVGDTAGPDAA